MESGGRVVGKVEVLELDDLALAQAHRYVLLQSPKISPYLDHFLNERRKIHQGRYTQSLENKWVVEEFPWWLPQQVPILESYKCDEETIALARGPSCHVKRFKAFIMNGFRFHTRDREMHRRTQNSGIVVDVKSGAGEDMKIVKYYGSIRDIYELDYYGWCKVIIFRCDWVNVNSSRGYKKDKYGLPMVNFSRLIHTGEVLKDDPFVISADTKQVFYVQDGKETDWKHVIETKPRDMYDMGKNSEEGDDESYTQCVPLDELKVFDICRASGWRRTNIENDLI